MEIIEPALSHGSSLHMEALGDKCAISIGIKRLFMLIEMAKQEEEAKQGEKFLYGLYDTCRY